MKWLIVASIFLVFSLFSQEQKFNYSDFKNAKDIDSKTKISLVLWNEYLRGSIDSLKVLSNELLLEGLEKKSYFAIASGKRAQGSFLIRDGKGLKGIQVLKEAKYYFEKIGDYTLLTETLSEIGNGYNLMGEPKNAIIWYNKSLVAGQKSEDPTSEFLAEINIAKSYTDLNQLDKAEKIILHYIKQTQKYKKIESEANAWTRLGIVYQLRGDNKLASKYFLKSTFLNVKAGSKIQASHGYNNLAIVCFEENDLEGALLNFEKALKLRLECHNWKAISESYFNIGEYYLEVKNHSKAIENYNKSLEVASNKGLLVEKMDALDAIIKVYKSKKDFVKAFQLMEEYLKVKSILLESDKIDLINASEMDLILQEKEQKLIQSNRESELFEKMKKQKMNMYFLIGGFSILFIVFIGFLFYKKPINKV